MKRFRYLLLFVFGFVAVHLQAQIAQYPVQVYTQVAQATPYVLQYYSGNFPRLRVSITNTDFQSGFLKVYLKMKIVSNPLQLISRDYITPPLTLDAGMPLQLSGEDLAVYFRPENLQISGNQSQYLQTRQLPDAFYTFHFEVYDYATNRLLSNPKFGSAFVNIRLGEPPVLNFPENKTTITETAIPNIMFSWRPALNLPAGYNSTEYEFSLVEIYDRQVNPAGAFDYSRVLLKETVRTSAFVYNSSHPMLIPGMRYAWRVRAIARDGIEEVPVIKNNGFSPVFWFDYAVDCQPVSSTSAVYENRLMNISWMSVPNVEAYSVQYRKKGQKKWYDGKISGEICPLYNLLFGEEYEYRVGSRCIGNANFVYTDARAFRMPAQEETYNMNCGIMPNTNIVNRTPAPVLLPGLPVMAGDFPVFIIQSTGSNGRFSGEGYVGIPYLKNLQVAVTFNNILVNSSNELIEGYFETKYDLYNNMVVDIDQALGGGGNANVQVDYKVDYTIDPNGKVVPVGIIPDENGKYTFIVTDSEGNSHTIESENVPTIIQDNNGNVYAINDNGIISSINSASSTTENNEQITDPKTFYLIEGHKFYNGNTIYLPLSNKQYAIKAYRDSVNLFSNGSVWSGVTSQDSATVRFTPNVVSSNIDGTQIRTIYNDSTRNDTLQCRIVVVSVVFEEDPTQKWGFDENDVIKEDLYSSYKTTLPKSGIKWKSVRSDDNSYDKLKINVYPAGAEQSVLLLLSDSIHYGVRPKKLSSNQQSIEVRSSVNRGEASLFPKIGYFINDTMQVKIKGYDLITRRVAIISVNESNDDVQIVNFGDTTLSTTTVVIRKGNNGFLDTNPQGDDLIIGDSIIVAGANKICETVANNTDIIATVVPIANIQTALTNRYKYAVVEFIVEPTNHIRTVNYDLNRNGRIDIQATNSAYLNEMKVIVDSCKISGTNLYNLFIVDFPDNNNTNGMMLFNQPYGFFFPRKAGGGMPSDVSATAAHEIGHGAFRLRHPWDAIENHTGYPNRYNNDWTAKDINNLLEWDGGWLRDKIRKYQWDKIRTP